MLHFKTSERNGKKKTPKQKNLRRYYFYPLHWQDLKTGNFGKSTRNYALAHTAGKSIIFTTFREVTGY